MFGCCIALCYSLLYLSIYIAPLRACHYDTCQCVILSHICLIAFNSDCGRWSSVGSRSNQSPLPPHALFRRNKSAWCQSESVMTQLWLSLDFPPPDFLLRFDLDNTLFLSYNPPRVRLDPSLKMNH